MIGGRGVRLAEQVALGDEELYVSIDVDAASGEALVRQASAVERSWLPAEQVVSETVVEFDEQTEKVTAKKRVVVRLAAVGRIAGGRCPATTKWPPHLQPPRLPGSNACSRPMTATWPAFARVFNAWPSGCPISNLPQLDDEQLRGLLPQLAQGRRSLADLRRAPWLHALKGLFTWQQLQTIDREAPERIEVPSGSRMTLKYEVGRPPILAVRIQEVFGLSETPRIAGGRVPVLMHLLAPNMRVAQVTDDLASFWANTYVLVRKDLRARYPKHAWPEDPYTAIAQRRPRK